MVWQKISIILVLALGLAFVLNPAPIPLSIQNLQSDQSLAVYDRDHSLLRKTLSRQGGRRRFSELSEVSGPFLDLLIHTEDSRFWFHPGVDPLALARAALLWWQNEKIISGGSTITMQLVRLSDPKPRRISVKVIEIVKAIYLEMALSKRQILKTYINHIPFSNQIYGVSEAAEVYFNKLPQDLSLAESAYLLGVIRAPTLYNPYKNHLALQKLKKRILKNYFLQSHVSEFSQKQAYLEKIDIQPLRRKFEAPHFTDFVLENLKQTPRKIISSLNQRWNQDIQLMVQDQLDHLSDKNVHQASVLVIKNETGEILSYVGSVNYWDDEFQGMIDGVRQFRQPGSALKPFTFARALDVGVSPNHVLADVNRVFSSNVGDYIPENYDRKYRGPVLLRSALANSLNIPAIQILQKMGVVELYQVLQKLNFSQLREMPGHYGLGLTLGNVEVSLLELVRAYSIFARDGQFCELTFLKQKNDFKCTSNKKIKKTFSAKAIHIIRDFLSDPLARRSSFGDSGPLSYEFPVMVKTGTSQNYRDNWTVAVTPEYTVGVWVGNFNGEAMQGVSGVSGAGPLSHKIVSFLYRQRPWRTWNDSSSFKKEKVCSLSGKRPSMHCTHTKMEYVFGDLKACDFHKRLLVDKRNGLLANASCDQRYIQSHDVLNLPEEFIEWQMTYDPLSLGPTAISPLCSEKKVPTHLRKRKVKILSPQRGAIYKIDYHRPKESQFLSLKVTPGLKPFWVELDGQILDMASSQKIALVPGKHELKLLSKDDQTVIDQISYRVR